MSNEEMNRKMEFIVEQQAKFAVGIQMMREVQAADSKLFKEQYDKLSEALIDIAGSLARAQMRTEDRVNLLEDSFNRLAQAQARTEESLTILINVVERHISGNGGSANPS